MSGTLLDWITTLMQRRAPLARREVKRLAPLQRTLCYLQRSGETASAIASVQTLSLKGIGLLAPLEFPRGTVLSLMLVNTSSTFALSIEMTIIRCFRAAGDRFYLGGPFRRTLRHHEIVPFLV
jgi:hypothetical protein